MEKKKAWKGMNRQGKGKEKKDKYIQGGCRTGERGDDDIEGNNVGK